MDKKNKEAAETTIMSTGNSSLRSEAMNEIISRKPGFLENWALLFYLSIIILLLGSTWIIHYPDIIKVRATLISTNAPKEILSRQDGRIIKLLVHNNETVSKGAIIAFIESNAAHEEIIHLSDALDSTNIDLAKNNMQHISNRFSTNYILFGELQQNYQKFISAYQQFKDYLEDGYYLKKKKILNEDILFLRKNYAILQQQKSLVLKDLNLSEETYKATEQLYKDKVISKQDDRNEQSRLLNKQISIPQINASLLNNESLQREKQKEISELEHSISIQKTIFQQSLLTLKSFVDEWEMKYIIRAPLEGKLIFSAPLQENQFIRSGKYLGFIVPNNSQYYAEVFLPQFNFGKINKNQIVQLRFDAYPYQEYGFLKGQITYISDLPTDSGFLAHIQMPNGLITNLKQQIHYREGLKAEALIITKDLRLAERFYYNISSTINR